MRPVSSNYSSVFGIPLVRGRFFSNGDTSRTTGVAVISEAMAKKFWPKGNPIGERITIDKYLGPDFAAPPREIIGVVSDVRDLGMNKEPSPMIYLPQAQVPNGMTSRVHAFPQPRPQRNECPRLGIGSDPRGHGEVSRMLFLNEKIAAEQSVNAGGVETSHRIPRPAHQRIAEQVETRVVQHGQPARLTRRAE